MFRHIICKSQKCSKIDFCFWFEIIYIAFIVWILQIINAKCIEVHKWIPRTCFTPSKQIQTLKHLVSKEINGFHHHQIVIVFWIGGGKNLRKSWLLQSWRYAFGEFQLPKLKPRGIFPLLESSHHFVDVIFKLNLHNLIFVNKN